MRLRTWWPGPILGFYRDLELQPYQPFLEAVSDYIGLRKVLYGLTHSLSLSPLSPSLSVCLCLSLFLSSSFATGSEYVRTSFNPDAAGLKGLEWDSAELFRVSQLHSNGQLARLVMMTAEMASSKSSLHV